MKRAPRTNPVRRSARGVFRNVAAWVDLQTFEELSLMADARGITKSGYLRELIEREVEACLSVSALRIPQLENGNAETSPSP